MLKKVLYHIKTFVEKCVLAYKNDEEFRKLNNNIIFYFILICFVDISLCFLFKTTKLLFVPFVMCFYWFWELFNYIPPYYIQPNMNVLPNKVGKYPVAIQYTPPKGLGPSEVGLLYNLKSSSTNIICLLYKRQYEGIIEIKEEKDGKLLLRILKNISDNTPDYEKECWIIIFGAKGKAPGKNFSLDLNAKMNLNKICDVHEKLLEYCLDKGRLLAKKQSSFGCLLVCLLLLLFILFSLGNRWCYFILFCILGSTIKILQFSLNDEMYYGKKLSRTDKGDELYAHIIGYKYWLETCEEQQIIKILEEDSLFKDRNLPYIIALRMNWKFLDRKFSKYK